MFETVLSKTVLLGARLRGRLATQRSKKGSEKGSGRGSGEGFSEGFREVGFQKVPKRPLGEYAPLSGVDKRVVSKKVVLADVLPERKQERGYIRMLPRNENRNEVTFACSPGTKNGTRVRSPKPPFYETALCLLSNDLRRAP